MDNFDDVDDANSIEELEQRRLALEKVSSSGTPPSPTKTIKIKALMSGGDDSSDESDDEGGENMSKSDEESASEGDNSQEDDDNWEVVPEETDEAPETSSSPKRPKMECPMKSAERFVYDVSDIVK